MIDTNDDRKFATKGTQVLPCVHCDKPTSVPSGQHPETVFCCSGCRGAYALIQSWNLEQFYELRDQLNPGGESAVATTGGCEIFETPELLGKSEPRELESGVFECEFALQGLHCGACAWLIENAANRTEGWLDARVKMSSHTVSVVYQGAEISLAEIARTLSRLGYQPIPLSDSHDEPTRRENRRLLIKVAVAGFCAANTMWIAIALYAAENQGVEPGHFHFLRWTSAGLGLFAVLGPGQTFLRGALASLRARTPHMDLPVGLGLVVGTVVGVTNTLFGSGAIYFDSLAILVFLLLIGRWIQFRQQYRAAKAVDLMMRLTPNHAQLVLDDGTTQTVPVQTLLVGQVVRVSAGDGIPVDGRIASGTTTIDQSLLTGESRPVTAAVGEDVFAGTMNLQQSIDLEVAATGRESRIGKVMRLVESAAEDRPPIVQWADRVGGVFVAVVTLLAVVTFAFWFSSGWQHAAANATSLLIVACPCALALATPLAIAVSLGRAARRQILVRDGGLLQQLAGRGTIWLDKTGTLTAGRPQVTEIDGPHPDLDAVLAMAAAVEKGCVHPLAIGIIDAAEVRGLVVPDADSKTTVLSGGIEGTVHGHRVHVGNLTLIQRLSMKVSPEDLERIRHIERQGKSPILVAVDSNVAAVLSVSDPIRDDAAQLVHGLLAGGWKIGILSGDNPEVVSGVANELGIDPSNAHGGLTPEDKLAVLRGSRAEGRTCMMVGDGANDAAALAAANVGIAVRGGAEVSLQAAPVYVGSGKLASIDELVRGATSTQRLIRTTFAVSLGYNVIAVALAVTGSISPLIAAVLMPISSASVLAITLAWPTFRGDNA